MKLFEPDYRHIENAARNLPSGRLPLYEHLIDVSVMEAITNRPFDQLQQGDDRDLAEYFAQYCGFFRLMGYDSVSFERCFASVMPGSGALSNSRMTPAIRTQADFDRYPWDEIPDLYFAQNRRAFEALRACMPAGMKAVGGVGNGVFECVQDLVGYENLCYLSVDEPELYTQLFERVGDVMVKIWVRFMQEFSDIYCVLRFGDDLGYRSSTMLSANDVRRLIIPQYKRVIDIVHAYGKPFLFHSCGCIFNVMEDLINVAGIDAKHSNEDEIAPFPVWVERYGDRIGNFGGIDTDVVCRTPKAEMREYIADVVKQCSGHGGFAFGSGNSIPWYVPTEQFLAMNEIVREIRGE